ncbi:MAG: Tagatose-6-phosphate kinase [Planctomycetes bacterium]|nr:Tagatose-6-phosphate kinase [Planctomycetota bacterium]
MIVTLTPNPALDKTLLVAALRHGAVNRARESHLDPGGKGVNAARVVHRLGRPAVALVVAGGAVGKLLLRELHDEGVTHEAVWVPEETRLNVIVVDEATGESTRVWDRGAPVPPSVLSAIGGMRDRHLDQATVLVCAGTLPPGVPDDWYAECIEAAHERGVRTILDSDGESFRAGLAAEPSVIKPNAREAEYVLGRRLVDEKDVIAGAVELLRRGPEAVVISMGGSGSVLATEDGVVRAIPPTVDRKSAVGSGDSLVAGLAIALHEHMHLSEGLRIGTAAGAATAMTVGTQLGTREEIDALLPSVRMERVA